LSEIAIRVDGLGKQYRIGTRERYHSLRDTLARSMRNLFRRRSGSLTPRGGGAGWGGGASPDGTAAPAAPDTIWALKDVSFEVERGAVVGIIGRNGAGKSTLLKILSRITEPTAGSVELHGRVGSLLEVGTGFHAELTGRENIYLNGAILGMTRAEIQRKFDEIVAFAEVDKFLDTPVKHYSSGMYMRLAFAVAAHLEPEILLVDEVLAVGDAEFQQKCLGKIGEVAREGRTVLFVSHNMAAIRSLCERGTLLDAGKLIAEGEPSEVIAAYMKKTQRGTVVFENKPVKSFVVRQVGQEIELVAEVSADTPFTVACLGFVISDHTGNRICGTNPVLSGLTNFGKSAKRGIIRARLREPKLLDGSYRVSLWFGDGTEDVVFEPDCLIFEIAGMAGPRQFPASAVGPVAPSCEWSFEVT
jgi:lipopolysaccharide transport system ATP-binding protein